MSLRQTLCAFLIAAFAFTAPATFAAERAKADEPSVIEQVADWVVSLFMGDDDEFGPVIDPS